MAMGSALPAHGGERAAGEDGQVHEEDRAPGQRHPLHPEVAGSGDDVDDEVGEAVLT